MQLPQVTSSPGFGLSSYSDLGGAGVFSNPIPSSVTNPLGDPTLGNVTDGAIGGFTPLIPGFDKAGGGLFGGLSSAQKLNAILGGIGTIGGLYASFKQLGLANKQFDFQRNFSNANMANQVQSYNTALGDRERSRAVVEGQSPAQAQSYIDANKLAYKPL